MLIGSSRSVGPGEKLTLYRVITTTSEIAEYGQVRRVLAVLLRRADFVFCRTLDLRATAWLAVRTPRTFRIEHSNNRTLWQTAKGDKCAW
jgi:hypothetical protein